MTPPQSTAKVSDEVPSPCISVCTLLEPQKICIGCFRTIDEIAHWSVLDAAARRAVLAALPARRAALGFPETPAKVEPDAQR
jgi:hypothetical protein